MDKFEIQGKEFAYPDRIINQRVFDIADYEKATKSAWFVTREGVEKMMRLVIDGPHDEIDWGIEDGATTIRIYKGFFPFYAKKIAELE
jgi:hypothetical protein